MSATENVARTAAALGPGAASARWFRAPGRVNLMGDHTDYNEGFVLPMAIDLECVAGVGKTTDGRVRLRSLDVGADEALIDVAADGSDEPSAVEPAWGRYVAGVVRALAERGRGHVGLEGVVASTVPVGSGLSSSAALEVATALALADAGSLALSAQEIALACQRAEQIATGVPSGIMDQLSSVLGEADRALLVDCRSLAVEHRRLPPGISVLVVHSGVPRALAGSAYAERRAACEALAHELGIPALRDATLAAVRDNPIGRHVVTENARVHETARAFETGNRGELARLYRESQASLRDDYRVSTPELNALVAALLAAGAIGARITGAGFGGCVVALVDGDRVTTVRDNATRDYLRETGIEPRAWVCKASTRAGRLNLQRVSTDA